MIQQETMVVVADNSGMYCCRSRSKSDATRARTVNPDAPGFCTMLKKPNGVKSHM